MLVDLSRLNISQSSKCKYRIERVRIESSDLTSACKPSESTTERKYKRLEKSRGYVQHKEQTGSRREFPKILWQIYTSGKPCTEYP